MMSESLSNRVKALEERAVEQGRIIAARDDTIRAHKETIRGQATTILAHEATINHLRGEKEIAEARAGPQTFKLLQLGGLEDEKKAAEAQRAIAEAKLHAATVELNALKNDFERMKRTAGENNQKLAAHMREVFDIAYGHKRARTGDAE